MKLKSRKELYEIEPMLPEVLEFAVTQQVLSISMIQRRFRVGYPRAAYIMDLLVKEGFVEENMGGPRKVLLSLEEYNNAYDADTSYTQEPREQSSFTQTRKGVVGIEDLHLDNISFYDEFDVPVDEDMQQELRQTLFDILCKDALVNLSSDFLLEFLKKKQFKVKYIKLALDDGEGILKAADKLTSPVIYIVDVAQGSIMEILQQSNLLIKEGSIVLRKANIQKSMLTILY